MGSVFSRFTRNSTSSRIESDPFITSPRNTEKRMAGAGFPCDSGIQQDFGSPFSGDEYARYTMGLQICNEFLNHGGSILERQRALQTELDTCHER